MNLIAYREDGRLRVGDLRDRTDGIDEIRDEHIERSHDVSGNRRELRGASLTASVRSTAWRYRATPHAADVELMVASETVVSLRGNREHGFNGDAALHGDGHIDGPLRLKATSPGEEARPWTISAVDADGDQPSRELRIELGSDPTVDPSKQHLSIGSAEITAAGSLTIHGDLDVAGQLSSGDIPPDPADPRFASAIRSVIADAIVQASFLSGIPLAVTPLPATRPASLDVVLGAALPAVLRWGIALDMTRAGTHRRLVEIVDGPIQGGTTRSIPLTWQPPLAAGETFDIRVAVAAIDTNRSSFGGAASVTVTVPT
jgi:hypothetical protein